MTADGGPVAVDHVTTARLVGRRPEPGDADAYVRFYGDPRTPEELWPSDLRTADHARATLEEFIEHWQRWASAYGRSCCPAARSSGTPGCSTRRLATVPRSSCCGSSNPDYWNRGYATQMAREAVRMAFDVLELDDVISFTVHGNAASRAVMEKLGMTFERDVEHVGLPHALYRLTRGR